jgi:hypothetical protein
MPSLHAAPEISRKRLITRVITGKIGAISALRKKFSLISGSESFQP